MDHGAVPRGALAQRLGRDRDQRCVLDGATVGELRDFAASVHAQRRHQHLILDLSELTHADADGLGALISVRTLLDRGELSLVCPQGRTKRLLRGSGAAASLPVYPSPDAALSAPRAMPAHRMGGAVQ
ncbi:STAS domain-containing protein [Streptomyces sp. NPDC001480]|uniref:STAS domain-containing protein n=1 Tax=Streptomyces sp. NPDC001480 TaxID=3364577 RepID=UPI0036BACBDB